MPVFNRLPLTQRMVECLRAQQADEEIVTVVVDDGSTDGTGAYLAAQPDITTLKGDGNLWWGGAIQRALDHVLWRVSEADWIVFVNNDTEIQPDFIAQLLQTARHTAPSAIGSVIRDVTPPHGLLSIGARIDGWRILTRDGLGETGQNPDAEAIPVDALSGRGVLYPAAALRAVNGMRPGRLPHYLADYELSLRVRRAGWRLLVSPRAAVYSHEDYGNSRPMPSLRQRLFSVRSPFYMPALLSFWWEASNWPQRLTLPMRAVCFLIFPGLRKTR
jgi:GT2 family glycosyltransferase